MNFSLRFGERSQAAAGILLNKLPRCWARTKAKVASMGGVAIEGAERLDAATYAAVVEFCKARLKAKRIQETASVRDKTTHGDVDLIVVPADEAFDLHCLDPTHVANNSGSHVTSVGVALNGRTFQVDIQRTTLELFDHQLAFNSYGMFGMCLGMGLRHACPSLVYGLRGLEWRTMELSQTGKDFVPFLLSTSNAAIMQFLHLDAERFSQGFDSYEDVFKFILQCPYIDAQQLAGSMQKPTSRCGKERKYTSRMASLRGCDFSGARAALPLPDPLQHFGKEQEFADVIAGIQRAKQLAERLNGGVVQELTGLQGRELGALLKALKAAPRDWLQLSSEEVKAAVLEEAARFREGGDKGQGPAVVGTCNNVASNSQSQPATAGNNLDSQQQPTTVSNTQLEAET